MCPRSQPDDLQKRRKECCSEAGRSTLLPNSKGNSSDTHMHSCPDARMKTHICRHLCIHALVLLFSPFIALLQWFHSHTVFLSWHIQSMNTRSQQVWTQLLNIQPRALACPHHRCLLPPYTLLISPFSPAPIHSISACLPVYLSTALPPPPPLLSALHFH